jgi:hypothetical protein
MWTNCQVMHRVPVLRHQGARLRRTTVGGTEMTVAQDPRRRMTFARTMTINIRQITPVRR